MCSCVNQNNCFIPLETNELVADTTVIYSATSGGILKCFASSPVEGASAPLSRFLSFTGFSICKEKLGQIFRYFVKNLFFRTF